MIIGVIGKSGSGKTSISSYFGNNGYKILELDNISKDLYRGPNSGGYLAIRDTFGDGVVKRIGEEIDTSKLASIVFNNKGKMNKLNKIMKPLIEYYVIKEIVEKHWIHNDDVILDGALLLDTKLIHYCDVIIYVGASRKTRVSRLINRGVKKDIVNKMADVVKINMKKLFNLSQPVIMINNNDDGGDIYSLVQKISKIKQIGVSMMDNKKKLDKYYKDMI